MTIHVYFAYFILLLFDGLKVLEEPGKDTSKFDTIMPTVVRPCTKDTFTSDVVSPRFLTLLLILLLHTHVSSICTTPFSHEQTRWIFGTSNN